MYNGVELGEFSRDRIRDPEGESKGPYKYTVYAFIGLTAGLVDLRRDAFRQLACFIVGVNKAPGIHPRTTDLIVTAAQLRDAYNSRANK